MRRRRGLCRLVSILLVVFITLTAYNYITSTRVQEETSHSSQQPQPQSQMVIRHSLPPMRTDLQSVGSFNLKYWRSHHLAPRLITKKEYDIMIEMFRVIDSTFRNWNITYSMISGTLIGSWFYHDILPWDDDADLIADFWQRQAVKQALSSIGGPYRVADTKKGYFKLYRTDGKKRNYEWTWPFVDIFFFVSDGNNFCMYDYPDKLIPLKDLFPLNLRPLGKLWLPSPANVPLLIYHQENITVEPRRCITNSYDHIREKYIIRYEIDCSELQDTYPFVVERRPVPPPWMSVETLILGQEILQEVSIPLPEF